ncbi:p-hydroxybenzoate hydroxylase [Streptomyces sp. AVP053U2]|nr:p-hydroxybenzoate hydroxylase [Streptomyces sp. AVP053U2]
MSAGPAGLTVGSILRAAGVECLALEAGSREFIERRPRAGVTEEGAVRGLERRGLARDLLERAELHSACEFRFHGERYRSPYRKLTGSHHWIRPQPLLVTDLVRAYADVRGGQIRFGVREVRLHDMDGDRPSVPYTCPETGGRQVVECSFVAGCDGARGATRARCRRSGRVWRGTTTASAGRRCSPRRRRPVTAWSSAATRTGSPARCRAAPG